MLRRIRKSLRRGNRGPLAADGSGALEAGPEQAGLEQAGLESELLAAGAWIDDVLQLEQLSRSGAVNPEATFAEAFRERFAEHQDRFAEALRGRSPYDVRAGAVRLVVTLDRHVRWAVDRAALAHTPANDAIAVMSRRKLGWEPAEVQLLWREVARLVRLREWDLAFGQMLRLPLAAAEELPAEDLAPLRPVIREVLEAVETPDRQLLYQPTDRRRLTRRLADLYERGGGADPDLTLPETLLADLDDLGPDVRGELLGDCPAEVCAPLLRHLAAYSGGTVPGQAWRRRAGELVASSPSRPELLRRLLERACAHSGTTVVHHPGTGYQWGTHHYVGDRTAQMLRAAVWAAAQTSAVWVPDLLGRTALHCGSGFDGSSTPRCSPAASSAIIALGELDDDRAVAQLTGLQARVKNRTLRKTVDRALRSAATRAGLTPGQLQERTVPTLGLTETERPVGDHTAVLVVQDDGVRMRWRTTTGRELRSVPKAVREEHAETLAELRGTVREAGKVLATERARLEGLLAADRTWTGADLTSSYLDHPLTGHHASRLLWQLREGPDHWVTGRPVRARDGWTMQGLDCPATTVRPDAEVRLWHPLRSDPEEVRSWREQLTAEELRQPFKQAFREVYLLTAAEQRTRSYSNRFAAHILRYPQAAALIRARGWTGTHLGYWDGGYHGQATRVVGEDGWRAVFYYDLVDNAEQDGSGTPGLCSTDQVRFERLADEDGTTWRPADLSDVPPLVFSEAMRDVDLFVSVTSIAGDPEWHDRGPDAHRAYWQRTSFGDLTESARLRREALLRLMPRTRIADRVRVTDRFLEVDGSLHTYKIHLASGNVLMSPDDAYLCIVPGPRERGGGAQRLFLPFEEDGGRLSLIISKAFLLADDAAITDPTILSQIKR